MNFKNSATSAELLMGGLAYAFYWLDESLQRSMQASGYKRVNRTQSMIVIYVSAGLVRPSALAKSLGISRQAIHQALREMQDILELRPDPEDKRAKIVGFCQGADDLRQAAANVLQAIENKLAERIGRELIVNLKAALTEDWGNIVEVTLNKKSNTQ